MTLAGATPSSCMQLDQVERAALAARFMRQVIQREGCWLWTGETTSNGYGRFKVAGRRFRAHRWAFENIGGNTIPANRVLDHLCGVPRCVNPAHLEPVTQRINTLRGTSPSAINARKTACPQGHPYDWVSPRGFRRCRECHRAQKAERRRALRETQARPVTTPTGRTVEGSGDSCCVPRLGCEDSEGRVIIVNGVAAVVPTVEVEEMTVEDGRRMLNMQTMDKLGITREDFLNRLDAGDYRDTEDETILRLVMLAPFGR